MSRPGQAHGIVVAGALALGGCAPEQWLFVSFVDAEPDVAVESGTDASQRGCLSEVDCVQSALHCDVRLGTCVVCLDDSQCTQPSLPHCSPLHTKCLECLDSPTDTCRPGQKCLQTQCFFTCTDGGACPAGAPPLCNTNQSRNVCVNCLKNEDCAAGEVCRAQNGTCGEGVSSTSPFGNDGGVDADSGDGGGETSTPSDASTDAPWPRDAAMDASSSPDATDSSD